jgi:hypothetical protein
VAGYNYAGGHDLHFTAHARIATSNFGMYGAFGYGKEKLTVDKSIPEYKEPVKSYIGEAGVTYSFYDKMIQLPMNLFPYFGVVYNVEKSNVADRQTENKNKTWGNAFGVGIEYYLTKNIALTAKQMCFLLYDSDYGNFRTATAAGITIKF